jgi:hypothetical protein
MSWGGEPSPADHAAPDSRALLVETDGQRLLYTGDLRAHGRTGFRFENLLTDDRLHSVDWMFVEGTTLGSSGGTHGLRSESDVEEKLVELARGHADQLLAVAAEMDQATIVRLEAGSIVAPRPDKLSRIARVLGISGADVFAFAGYTVPSDLPTLRPYLQAKYRALLKEDLDRIEAYVGHIAKQRGFDLVEVVNDMTVTAKKRAKGGER